MSLYDFLKYFHHIKFDCKLVEVSHISFLYAVGILLVFLSKDTPEVVITVTITCWLKYCKIKVIYKFAFRWYLNDTRFLIRNELSSCV